MRRTVIAAFLAVAVGGCGGGISLNSDYAEGTDFAPYRTWNYMPSQGSTANAASNQLVDQRLRTAVERTMTEKGFRRDTSDPDFYVGYHLILDDQTSYETVNDYWGTGWGYGGMYGSPMTTSNTRAINYTVGTLVVDFFDAGERELIWRGTAEGTIQPEGTPVERQARADEAVGKILEQFPPGL
jgi:hypothetical protein